MNSILRRVEGLRSSAQRPPVWLLVFAGSFCLYFLLLVYCDVARPASPGFVTNVSADGAAEVTIVTGDSAASRAGMQIGDRIVSMNGVRLHNARARKEIGVNAVIGPNSLVVGRGRREVELNLILERAPRSFWGTPAGATLLVLHIAQLLMLLSGLVILARRPRDSVALTASWFLLTCAVFTIALPWRLASVWRGLPPVVNALLFVPHASGLVIGPVLLTFVAGFPRRLPYARYVQAVTWIVASAVLWSPLTNFIELVYGARELKVVGPGSRPLLAVTSISLVAAVAIVVAQALAMVPITPGGLGFVESGLTALLVVIGIPADTAVIGTLLYRLVSFWLPIPVGALAWAGWRIHRGRTGSPDPPRAAE